MSKLTITRGLPGSGKTTWALEELARAGNTLRVNRDELRTMLYGPDFKWTGGKERLTIALEKQIASAVLVAEMNIIIDDTNILNDDKYWEQWMMQANLAAHHKYEVRDFTHVPIKTCIERDSIRRGRALVGRGVIERMALRGGLIDLEQYEKIAIVDIDGTLANLDHRLQYLQQTPKAYRQFYGQVFSDGVFDSVRVAVQQLHASGHHIIILSGRPCALAEDHNINVGWLTDNWLCAHNIPNHHLFMRQTGDYRPDNEVKRELWNIMINAGLIRERVKIIMDDRESICNEWRMLKLPLVKVDHGAAVEVDPQVLVAFPNLLGIPVRY